MATQPWPMPDQPHLRRHQLREVGENVEHWIWEPTEQGWRLGSSRPRVVLDALARAWVVPPEGEHTDG